MMSPFRSLSLHSRRLRFSAVVVAAAALPLLLDGMTSVLLKHNVAEAQADANRALTLRSDVQEANAKTGVVTARGNVQIFYPSRQIQATAAQAQYFSKERLIILTGNVYVLQEGNSLRGETITYRIDEGRFEARPQAPKQVESIYLVQDTNLPTPTPAADTPVSQPEFPATPQFPASPAPIPPFPSAQPSPANPL